MRICHLASGDLWAGAEVQLATLLNGLQKYPDLELSAILFNSGTLADQLEQLDIEVQVLEESQYSSFQLMSRIGAIFTKAGVDLLHTHRYKENILGSRAAKRAGVPCIVRTQHGMPEPYKGIRGMKASMYSFLDRRTNNRSVDKLIAVSDDIKTQMAKSFDPNRIVRVYNGIDLDKLRQTKPITDIRAKLGFDSDAILVGSVGRLMPVKGYQYFLQAFRDVLHANSRARLVLAGDGDQRSTLESLAVELGIADEVHFYGFTLQAAELIASLDIFVLASLHEGVSISLLEALALGVPTVATAVGGNCEVIDDKNSGLLVPSRDPAGLAMAIGQLLDDGILRKKVSVEGRRTVADKFSKEIMAEQTYQIYRGLICRKDNSVITPNRHNENDRSES